MKTRLLASFALLIGLVAAGCSKSESPASASTAAAAVVPSGPRVIEISVDDKMKFSLATIEAKPGEQIKVILTNNGTQPKNVMGHNWVLLKSGADVEAFDKAASQSPTTEYFPEALKDQVLAHADLVGPRKSSETVFTAPATPGEYTFLCTFPSHYAVGMKGLLIVR